MIDKINKSSYTSLMRAMEFQPSFSERRREEDTVRTTALVIISALAMLTIINGASDEPTNQRAIVADPNSRLIMDLPPRQANPNISWTDLPTKRKDPKILPPLKPR